MIGIGYPSELDSIFRQIKALARVNGVEVDRITFDDVWRYPGFALYIYIDIDHVTRNREPNGADEWGVYYLTKGLRTFAGLRESTEPTQTSAALDTESPDPNSIVQTNQSLKISHKAKAPTTSPTTTPPEIPDS